MPKHGNVGNNGKTPKTESNPITLGDYLIQMPNRENIVQYTDGEYQGETSLDYGYVNLFDSDIICYCGV